MNATEDVAVKASWLLAFVLAGLGYVTVVAPGQARVADLDARSDALLTRVLAGEQAAKEADRLDRLGREIAVELGGVDTGGDRTAVIADFLRDVAARAAAQAVRLVSVQNESSSAAARVPATVAATDPFEAASLDVVLEGRYGAVIRTIAGLSQSRVLMRIEESAIDRARGPQNDESPNLSVQLKVTVFSMRVLPTRDDHAADPAT